MPKKKTGPRLTSAAEPPRKAMPRSEELKHNLTVRINRAVGQLNAVKDMIANDTYCADVVIQLSACERAIRAVERMVLQDHLETCVVSEVQAGNTEVMGELVTLFDKFVVGDRPCEPLNGPGEAGATADEPAGIPREAGERS